MSKALTTGLALALGLATSGQAITIDFEDLGPGSNPVPVNYRGLIWTDWTYYDNPDPPYDPSSGSVRIFNTLQDNSSLIEFGQQVTFLGSWMAGFGYDQRWVGYQNGVQIFESVHMPNDQDPFGTFINVNWPGVDAVRVLSDSGDHYVLDDIKYEPSAGVPDSGSTLLLLGSILGAIAVLRRRLA